jgi:aminoglycoside phosphotransferase (APT) family kinase protein
MDGIRTRGLDHRDAPVAALEPFMDENGLGTGTLAVAPVAGGHSNLTFLLIRGGEDFILRRPPRPPYAPSAHDVIREATVLRSLDGRARSPRVLALCEGHAVIGAPFYVMERMPGVVISERMPRGFDHGQARQASEELVELLSELHDLDPGVLVQAGLARPGAYVDRQLRRFSKLWGENQTRPVPDIDRVGQWLADNRPQVGRDCIVHGDFRIGNTTVVDSPAVRIAGLLDWEMATIGDPLVDLGYLLATWPDDHEAPTALTEINRSLAAPGCLTRDQARDQYCTRNGIAEFPDWYIVLAQWKAAIFLEGSRKRFLAGTTTDPFYETLDKIVPRLGEAARELAGLPRPL